MGDAYAAKLSAVASSTSSSRLSETSEGAKKAAVNPNACAKLCCAVVGVLLMGAAVAAGAYFLGNDDRSGSGSSSAIDGASPFPRLLLMASNGTQPPAPRKLLSCNVGAGALSQGADGTANTAAGAEAAGAPPMPPPLITAPDGSLAPAPSPDQPRLPAITTLNVAMPLAGAAMDWPFEEILGDTFLFLEAQRSGEIETAPGGNRIPWRFNQMLTDGADVGQDFVGGHYEAGSAHPCRPTRRVPASCMHLP